MPGRVGTLPPDLRSPGGEKKQRKPLARIRGRGGFSLLEVLVALAILGIGLGAILPGIGQSLRIRRDAADSVRLAVTAERLLGELALRTRAPTESEEGEEGGCRWSVEPLDLEVGAGVGPGAVVQTRRGAELVAVRLTVAVPDGPRWELTTLVPRGKPETAP